LSFVWPRELAGFSQLGVCPFGSATAAATVVVVVVYRYRHLNALAAPG
jgi:hypothetical protein